MNLAAACLSVCMAAISLPLAAPVLAHDVITTKITYNREIIRIIHARCGSCHRPGGKSFSLMTYAEARPWAKAMQEEVLERRMPPWGAIKGFGDFQNDQALTPEQIELIADWVEGGAPDGEEKDLPKEAPAFDKTDRRVIAGPAPKALRVQGEQRLTASFLAAGVQPRKVAPGVAFQMVAQRPDGSIEPLLWLQPFKPEYAHEFQFRQAVLLPKGTVIRGVPAGVEMDLLGPARSLKAAMGGAKAQAVTPKP